MARPAMRSGGRIATGACAALAVCATWMAAQAPPALGSHVGCGDTITADTTLDSDLLECPGDGIVIGADGITLDLAGHTIDGALLGPGDGVDNSAGHDGVTVTNGTITQFFEGVLLRGASTSVLSGLELDQGGIRLDASSHNLIEHNELSASAIAISLRGDSDFNRVGRNRISHTDDAIFLIADVNPPHATPDHNVIERNAMSESNYGVVQIGATTTRIERNVATHNEYGLYLVSQGDFVGRNLLAGNEIGIQTGAARQIVISRNDVSDSEEDGILIGGASSGITLDQNVSSHNAENGIEVQTSSARIAQNTANRNGELGIDAVPGVIDGGGNRAAGNGNPLQCVGVTCK